MTDQKKTNESRVTSGLNWGAVLLLGGAVITTCAAILILSSLLLNLMGEALGPYHGVFSYLLLPSLFVVGLCMMPLGVWLRSRTQGSDHQGQYKTVAFVIDLKNRKQLRFVLFVALMTVVNVALVTALSYQGYHYTESTAFCGRLCHSVMKPEYAAYQRSPHARVDCVECHIGSGASWFIKSKLSGLRQVWAVVTDDFSRPIPTPVEDLRPARDTCEQCHWPEVFHGSRPKVFRRVAPDGDPLDPEVTAVMLHVGGYNAKTGTYSGIHWHVSSDNRVEYRAVDRQRLQIRDVRVVKPDRSTTRYVLKELPKLPEDTPWRVMDCVDCHNRPTHIYETAEEAVDRQILLGRLDATLPQIKALALQAVQGDYGSQDAARSGIRSKLEKLYKRKHASVHRKRSKEIARAAKVLYQEVYRPNVFPELGIRWDTYPSHLGHQNESGCYRCHNDKHKADSGATISQDCDMCHSIIMEEERESTVDDEIRQYLF